LFAATNHQGDQYIFPNTRNEHRFLLLTLVNQNISRQGQYQNINDEIRAVSESFPKNNKITALVDTLLNDNSTDETTKRFTLYATQTVLSNPTEKNIKACFYYGSKLSGTGYYVNRKVGKIIRNISIGLGILVGLTAGAAALSFLPVSVPTMLLVGLGIAFGVTASAGEGIRYIGRRTGISKATYNVGKTAGSLFSDRKPAPQGDATDPLLVANTPPSNAPQ
jgi:hypothetical protein